MIPIYSVNGSHTYSHQESDIQKQHKNGTQKKSSSHEAPAVQKLQSTGGKMPIKGHCDSQAQSPCLVAEQRKSETSIDADVQSQADAKRKRWR